MNYTVNGRTLWNIDIQKDLGVQGHSSLQVATKLAKVITKADDMLAFISRALSIGVGESCCRYIKPWLGRIWSIVCCTGHHTTKWTWRLWKELQRMFTRMLPGLEGVGYEERLDKLGLFSLERRRLRGDLIEVNRIMRGRGRVDSQRLFQG